MNAALLALMSAVLTLLAYLLLTDQLEYATVRRRQIDAWAAMTALVCIVGIAYGGIAARHDAEGFGSREASAVRAAVEVKRVVYPDLARPAVVSSEVSFAPSVTVLEGGVASEPERVSDPDPNPQRVEGASTLGADGPKSIFLAEPRDDPGLAPIAAPAGPEIRDAIEVVIAAPTPTLQRVVTRVPLQPVRPAPTVELVLPSVTPEPPAQPTEPPAPTPFCGEPEAIRMTLRIDEARVDRESDPQAVRYRARVTNEAGFPVLVRNLLVTAQDSRSGSDQFGSDRQPDLQIEGGHSIAIEGAVKLEKYPSPFGRSELCVSFVTDSCGRQAAFPTTRRCFSISGF